MMKGRFFVFEGMDGSGKSTQVSLLSKRLQREFGQKVHETHEPSNGPVGLLLRQMLSGRIVADYRVIAQLFAADRMDHLTNGVDGLLGLLDSGVSVVCDRYYFSSFAYHSGDLAMADVVAANEMARALCRATVTIYLDLPPEKALERIGANRVGTELFETKERLTQTYGNYDKAFSLYGEGERILRIDASQTVESVAESIWRGLEGYLKE